MPAKLVQIKQGAAVVRELGIDGDLREIPFSKLRTLPPFMSYICGSPIYIMSKKYVSPRLSVTLQKQPNRPVVILSHMVEDILDKAFQLKKRPRTLHIPVMLQPHVVSRSSSVQPVGGVLICQNAVQLNRLEVPRGQRGRRAI